MQILRVSIVAALLAASCTDGRVDALQADVVPELQRRIGELETARGELQAQFAVARDALRVAGIVGEDGSPVTNWWCGTLCLPTQELCKEVARQMSDRAECRPAGYAYCRLGIRTRNVPDDDGVMPLQCAPTRTACEASSRVGTAPCVQVR